MTTTDVAIPRGVADTEVLSYNVPVIGLMLGWRMLPIGWLPGFTAEDASQVITIEKSDGDILIPLWQLAKSQDRHIVPDPAVADAIQLLRLHGMVRDELIANWWLSPHVLFKRMNPLNFLNSQEFKQMTMQQRRECLRTAAWMSVGSNR